MPRVHDVRTAFDNGTVAIYHRVDLAVTLHTRRREDVLPSHTPTCDEQANASKDPI